MGDTGDQVLDHLPVFSDVTHESQWERLRVQGLVEQPLELDQESLLALAQQGIAEDFHCVEGWVVPGSEVGRGAGVHALGPGQTPSRGRVPAVFLRALQRQLIHGRSGIF